MPETNIIITTYNRPDFLKVAIQSVINQTYRDWSLIIVNDAGQDVSDIVDSFHNKQIRYIYKDKNAGLGAARNTGLDHADGRFINFLDDDDKFYPIHLQLLTDFIKENKYKIVYSDAVCHVMKKNEYNNYDIINRVIPYSLDYNSDILLYQNITPVLCVLFEFDEYIQTLRLDETARVYEDWIYWLDITKKYDMHHLAIPTCLYTFRQDGSTMSSSRNEFTTMLPGIYSKTWQRAKNQVQVCTTMNSILQQRGLPKMFDIKSS